MTPLASHPPAPLKSRHFLCTMWPAGFELANSPSCVISSTTAPHSHLCLYFVLIRIYYTKPSVNCLFDTLNEFKLKSCQPQSSITFRDLQVLFWQFSHPRSFTKNLNLTLSCARSMTHGKAQSFAVWLCLAQVKHLFF